MNLPITFEEYFNTDSLGGLDMTDADITRDNFGLIDILDYYRNKGLTGVTLKPNHKFYDLEFIEVYSYNSLYSDNKITRYYISIYEPEFVISPDRYLSYHEACIVNEYMNNNWSMLIDTFKELYNTEYNISVLEEYNMTDKLDKIVWPDKSPDYRLLPSK